MLANYMTLMHNGRTGPLCYLRITQAKTTLRFRVVRSGILCSTAYTTAPIDFFMRTRRLRSGPSLSANYIRFLFVRYASCQTDVYSKASSAVVQW